MANGFGYNFSPQGRTKFGQTQQKKPGTSPQIGHALQVLSLRLPRVLGGNPIAPDALMRARGGPGPGAVAETLGQMPPQAVPPPSQPPLGGPSMGEAGPSLGMPSGAPPMGPPPAARPVPSLSSLPNINPSPFQQILQDLSPTPMASAPPPHVMPGLNQDTGTMPTGSLTPQWAPPEPPSSGSPVNLADLLAAASHPVVRRKNAFEEAFGGGDTFL